MQFDHLLNMAHALYSNLFFQRDNNKEPLPCHVLICQKWSYRHDNQGDIGSGLRWPNNSLITNDDEIRRAHLFVSVFNKWLNYHRWTKKKREGKLVTRVMIVGEKWFISEFGMYNNNNLLYWRQMNKCILILFSHLGSKAIWHFCNNWT